MLNKSIIYILEFKIYYRGFLRQHTLKRIHFKRFYSTGLLIFNGSFTLSAGDVGDADGIGGDTWVSLLQNVILEDDVKYDLCFNSRVTK